MQHAKMRPIAFEVARMGSDRWYVSTGERAIGPINLDLLERGIAAGKVPPEAFIRHEAWRVWRPLTELADITPANSGHTRDSQPPESSGLA